MKKLLVLLMVVTLLFAGCCSPTPDEMKNQINELKTERSSLVDEINSNNKELAKVREEVQEKQQELDLVTHKLNGDTPVFIFTLELKQSHVTLDFDKMLKDSMNKVKFDIAVDEELYNTQEIGDKLLKEFRGGSFLIEGSMGNWVITIVDKRIEYN